MQHRPTAQLRRMWLDKNSLYRKACAQRGDALPSSRIAIYIKQVTRIVARKARTCKATLMPRRDRSIGNSTSAR